MQDILQTSYLGNTLIKKYKILAMYVFIFIFIFIFITIYYIFYFLEILEL